VMKQEAVEEVGEGVSLEDGVKVEEDDYAD